MAHNNRGSWWLHQMCIGRFPFNRRRNYFSLMRSFGIYIRKARNRETKWRDKAITTSVTHNNVFCNTCCLNWNALITDYWGPSPVSRAWPGFGSLQAAANSIMSFWRLKAAQNCTTSGRGFVRTCKKKRTTKKKRNGLRKLLCQLPSRQAWETAQSRVWCVVGLLPSRPMEEIALQGVGQTVWRICW